MNKKWFIIFAIALFVLYCLGVATHVGKVPVPHYAPHTINLVGHYTGEYNPNAPEAKERLHNFARENYLRMPSNHNVNFADEILTEEKLREIATSDPQAAHHLTVVDGSSVFTLAKNNYHFAEDIQVGDRLLKAGDPLNVDALNAVIRAGKTRLRVSGHGETIAIQPGTMVMIMIIFIALLCALKTILFDPLVKIMDERDEEIGEGNMHRRENTMLAQKLERECAEARAVMRREHFNSISQAKHSANTEADGIVRKAHEEARRHHEETMAEIRGQQADIDRQISQATPALAKQIADKILGFSLK